jgi:hypothetical protein
MHMRVQGRTAAAVLIGALSAGSVVRAQQSAPAAEQALVRKARGIHERVIALDTFNVTLELVRRGYTEKQIGQIWSGSLLRVMDEVQKIAKTLQRK